MIETSIQASSYGHFEAFSNQRILNRLLTSDLTLSHVARGEILLAKKLKPTSKEFINEILPWLKSIDHVVHNIFIEHYGNDSSTIVTGKKDSTNSGTTKTSLRCHPIVSILTFSVDRFDYEIYSSSTEALQETVDIFEAKFKTDGTAGKETVRFAFWQKDEDGVASLSNSENSCPALSEIADNYPTALNEINQLINLADPYKHGKIVLWTGNAGNGKTHLIRGLARSWSEKYKIIPEVIIDPESLYDLPSYLTSLLLHGTSQVYNQKEPPFRLIIAEDCAQLFSTDCRNQTGFSRLLNTVDGLLGQGQKIIFLFTANEHITTVDPAILRPGRCLQNLEIPDWTFESAKKWLIAHEAKDKIDQLKGKDTISLAELYAILNGTMHAEGRQNNLGFK